MSLCVGTGESSDQGSSTAEYVGVTCLKQPTRSFERCTYNYVHTAYSDRPAKFPTHQRVGTGESREQGTCGTEDVDMTSMKKSIRIFLWRPYNHACTANGD